MSNKSNVIGSNFGDGSFGGLIFTDVQSTSPVSTEITSVAERTIKIKPQEGGGFQVLADDGNAVIGISLDATAASSDLSITCGLFGVTSGAINWNIGGGTYAFDGTTLFINGAQAFSKSAGNPPSVGGFGDGFVLAALDVIDFQIGFAGNKGSARADGFYFNNQKIIGARGAAVADATGAGDVVAQLNALLARCRAHGLIA